MKRKGNWRQNHDQFIKKHFPDPQPAPISVFICGGDCAGGGEHSWDGPDAEYEEGNCVISTGTCSKCGMHQIDYDLMRMP